MLLLIAAMLAMLAITLGALYRVELYARKVENDGRDRDHGDDQDSLL